MPRYRIQVLLSLVAILIIAFGGFALNSVTRRVSARLPTQAAGARPDPPLARLQVVEERAGRYVELEVQAAKERYCRGEPIVVECGVINHSRDHDVRYFCVYGRYVNPRDTDLTVRIGVTNRGEPVRTTRFGSHLAANSGSYRSLSPGTGATWRFTLNAVFDMTTTGEYRINASIPVQGPGEDGNTQAGWLVTSKPLIVAVDGDFP